MKFNNIKFSPKVNAIGQLYYDKLGIVTPVVASGDTPVEPEFLCFTAEESNSSVGMTHLGTNASSTKPVIYISADGDRWTSWDYTTITLANVGDKVYMYGENPNGISSSDVNRSSFTIGGRVAASGDITNLLAYGGKSELPFCCFFSLFSDCTALTQAPQLPATTLAEGCYIGLFRGCSSLKSAPQLPATTLTEGCYSDMFSGCTSLKSAPQLPATTLANGCYSGLFSGCTSLKSAPQLPATTLANSCYSKMFRGCSSLTQAVDLPATILADHCYYEMYNGCSALTHAPSIQATTLAIYSCYGMFYGCSSLTHGPSLKSATLADFAYYDMFSGCASLNSIECFATDISAENCVNRWLSGVSPTGTFTKSANMLGWNRGISGIPEGWTVLNA